MTNTHAHVLDDAGTVLENIAMRSGRFVPLDERRETDQIVDLSGVCLVPGLQDSHVHQIQAIRDLDTVDVSTAGSIPEMIDLLREAASRTPSGEWIIARRGWHESRLVEKRLPTRTELDKVGTANPIAVPRGSHLAVLNSAALRRAQSLPIERDEGGRPTGILRTAAAIEALTGAGGAEAFDARLSALARVAALHSHHGLVGVRDAGVAPDDVATYTTLADGQGIGVRTDVMVAIPPEIDHATQIRILNDLGPPPPQRHVDLRVAGIKLFVDGRIDDAALQEPYLGRSDLGVLHLDAPAMEVLVERAVALGWDVGCHVIGDRAMDVALNAYQAVIRRRPPLRAGALVIEHALLANEQQRQRAAALGIGVTVQHPLLYEFADLMEEHWGKNRAARASPVQGWLEAGALVAAGSDGHVVPFDPTLSIGGLATRRTRTGGAIGPDQGISIRDALRLHTVAGHWLAEWRIPPFGFALGYPADFTGFQTCLLEGSGDELLNGVAPTLTVIGGKAFHDPSTMWTG